MKRFLLLAAGTCILVYFIAAFFDPNANPVGLGSDGYEYWHLSSSILKHRSFAYTTLDDYPIFDLKALTLKDRLPSFIACTTRVPGYPLILAAGRMLWDSPWIAIIINILSYIGLCLYGFRLGDLIITHTGARKVFNFLLVFQPLIFVRWGVGADILSAFFLTGFVYHILKIANNSALKTQDVFWSIFFGIAANLTRSNLLIFTFTFIISVAVLSLIKRNIKTVFVCLFILSCLFVGTTTWSLRNYFLTNTLTLSTQGGAVLYTVHLAYDISEDNPLLIWRTKEKAHFIDTVLAQGFSFNQAEAKLDHKLKSVVKSYYQQNPIHLLKKFTDGLRTMFFFSYFDISDAIVLSRHPSPDRIAFANSSSSEHQNYSATETKIRSILFELSRIYKWLLASLFFIFPLVIALNRTYKNTSATYILWLYNTTWISLCVTALFTGAAGDRMRLPFYVLLTLFCTLSGQILFQFKKI